MTTAVGHYYITISQGVCNGGGLVYYDIMSSEIVDIEDKHKIKPEFLYRVINLVDYVVSQLSEPFSFDEFLEVLMNIPFLCRYKNLDAEDGIEMLFGFPSGNLCYDDDCELDDTVATTIGEHIMNMENQFLQADNADVFIVASNLLPATSN